MSPRTSALLAGLGVAIFVGGVFAFVVGAVATSDPGDPAYPSDEAYEACLKDVACDWQRVAEQREVLDPPREALPSWAVGCLAAMLGIFAGSITASMRYKTLGGAE